MTYQSKYRIAIFTIIAMMGLFPIAFNILVNNPSEWVSLSIGFTYALGGFISLFLTK
jgi:predicted membrane channel-forming protein YqfA (hemolysin III family)